MVAEFIFFSLAAYQLYINIRAFGADMLKPATGGLISIILRDAIWYFIWSDKSSLYDVSCKIDSKPQGHYVGMFSPYGVRKTHAFQDRRHQFDHKPRGPRRKIHYIEL